MTLRATLISQGHFNGHGEGISAQSESPYGLISFPTAPVAYDLAYGFFVRLKVLSISHITAVCCNGSLPRTLAPSFSW